MLSWVNSLEKMGIPTGLVSALFFLITGILITIPAMSLWASFTSMDTDIKGIEQHLPRLDSMMTKISKNQDINLYFMLELSMTQEFTSNSLVEMMQELGTNNPDALRVIIEKKKAVDQYQKDHLPHYKKRMFKQGDFEIRSEELTN